MDEPSHNVQTSKIIKLLTSKTNAPIIALCTYKKQNLSPFELLKIGFSDLLLKEDLTAGLLKHNLLTNLARNELTECREKPKKLEEKGIRKEFVDICKTIPLGLWKFDHTNNQLNFSGKMQEDLNLHPSIYNLSLTDFIRLVYPEDQKKVELFFRHLQNKRTTSTTFRFSLPYKKGQHKNILLLAAPGPQNAGKDFTQGLQIILPKKENLISDDDRHREIGEWVLNNALETLKEVSGSASLPIFKQITRIQQKVGQMQKGVEPTDETSSHSENLTKEVAGKNAMLKGLKDMSSLVDIYVKMSNDLMAYYMLTRGIPHLNELPFVIEDITSLLEAYFKKKARMASVRPVIENLGGGKQVILGNPGFSGFLFYNLIKAVIKITQPHSTATFRHQHKKSDSGKIIHCTLEISAQTEKIHPDDLKLLNTIKGTKEIGKTATKDKEKILKLVPMAICAIGLRSQGNSISFKQSPGGNLFISSKLYAETLEVKDHTSAEHILLLEPYAPRQLLLQSKLLNFFPQARIDIFDDENKMLAAARQKSWNLIFISSSYLRSDAFRKWLEDERTPQTPLVFLYQIHNKREAEIIQKLEQTYYLPKTFTFEALKAIQTDQTIDLLN